MKKHNNLFLITTISAITIFIMLYNFIKIRDSVFVFTDSIRYVGNATYLAENKGYKTQIGEKIETENTFPPFYSLIITLVAKIVGIDNVLYYSYILQLFLYLLMIFVTCILLTSFNSSTWSVLLMPILIVMNNHSTVYSLSPLSESLYIILGFLTLILIEKYCQTGNNLYYLLSIIFCTLAFYTRASGLALCLAISLTVFIKYGLRWQTFLSLLSFIGYFSFVFYLWLFFGTLNRYIESAVLSNFLALKWNVAELIFHIPVKTLFGFNFYYNENVDTFYFPLLKLWGTTKLSLSGIVSILIWCLILKYLFSCYRNGKLSILLFFIFSILTFIIHTCMHPSCREPRLLIMLLPFFISGIIDFFHIKGYKLALVTFCTLYILSNITGYTTYYMSNPTMSNVYEIHKNTKECIIEKGMEPHIYFKLCYNRHIRFCISNCTIPPEETDVLMFTFKENISYKSRPINCYALRSYANNINRKVCIYYNK